MRSLSKMLRDNAGKRAVMPHAPLAAVLAALAVASASSAAEVDQVWLSQSISFKAAEPLRLTFSNTDYFKHGEHFCNEEAASFRWTIAGGWSAGPGIIFTQNLVEKQGMDDEGASVTRHHWDWSGRPTEYLALDWRGKAGDWRLFDSNRVYMYFREARRDWATYRNIATVTAPALPALPWEPRPYLTQQIYFTDKDGYDGLDRFSQFRWAPGLRLKPVECLFVSLYWQYRDIETKPGVWKSSRVAGLSASLVF